MFLVRQVTFSHPLSHIHISCLYSNFLVLELHVHVSYKIKIKIIIVNNYTLPFTAAALQ